MRHRVSQQKGAIRDEQVVHFDFHKIYFEASVDPDTVADPSSSLSGSDREKACDYLAIVMFLRDQVRQVCAEAIPQVQNQPKFQGVSFVNYTFEDDSPPEELPLPLAQQAHQSLR